MQHAGDIAIVADLQLHRRKRRVGIALDQRLQPQREFAGLAAELVGFTGQQVVVQLAQLAPQQLHRAEHRHLGDPRGVVGFFSRIRALGKRTGRVDHRCREHDAPAATAFGNHQAALEDDVQMRLAHQHHALDEQQLAGAVVDRPRQRCAQLDFVRSDGPHNASRRPDGRPRFPAIGRRRRS